MKISRLTPFILSLLFILTFAAPVLAAEDGADSAPPELSSKACIIMNASSCETIYSVAEETPLYCGDLSAMVMGLVVVDAVDSGILSYDDTVTSIAADYYNIEKASPGFEPGIMLGEELTLDELLYCSLVGGSLEASNIIARLAAGSVSDFVVLMNEKVSELGCTCTSFSNVNGVDESGQFSCARDIALISREVIARRKLMDICTTVSREIDATNTAPLRVIRNTNYLIRPDRTRYYYPDAIGLKSGYSENAGYCVASALRCDGEYVIFVMLGAPLAEAENGYFDIQSFIQTGKLMRWFTGNYKIVNIVDSITPVSELPVSLGEGADSVVIRADGNSSVFLPKDTDTESVFTRRITFFNADDGEKPLLTAPVTSGKAVGEMYVDGLGRSYGPFTLVTNTDVPLSRFSLVKSRVSAFIRSPWLKLVIVLIVALIIAYIVIVMRINARRAKRRREAQTDNKHVITTIPRKKP